ncbi:MAG TPA: response regulator [Ktedonobacterales bacterium]
MTETHRALSRADVLLVEDDPDLREAMAWLFEDEGIPLRLANGGEQALAQVAAAMPALVLLDLTMPGLQPADLVRRLRGDPRTARIPIVVLSAARDVAVRARALGADGAVAKPYDVDDLVRVVRKYLPAGL